MPLPSNITRVPLIWDVIDELGGNAQATVEITPPAGLKFWTDVGATPPVTILARTITGQIISGLLQATGGGQVLVPATDDPDWSPTNYTHHMKATFQNPPGVVIEFDFPAPASYAGTGLDLSTLAPTDPSGGVLTTVSGTTSWQGKTGVITDASYLDLVDGDQLSTQTDAQERADGAQSAAQTYADSLLTGVSAGGFKGTKTIPSTPYHLQNADNGYLLEWPNSGPCTIIVDPDSTGHYDSGFSVAAVSGSAGGVISWQGASVSAITVLGLNSTTYNEAQANVFSPAIQMPAGITNGAGIVVTAVYPGGRTFSPLPSGTGYAFVEQSTQIGPSGTTNRVFKCINAPSSLSSQTITFPISGAVVGLPVALAVMVLGGVDTTDFIDAAANSGTTNTHTTPTVSTVAASCGQLSLAGATNGGTVYAAHPFTAASGITCPTTAPTANIGTTTASGGNCAAAIGYAGSSGTLTQFTAGTPIGGDTWTIAGIGNTRTFSIKPLAAAGAVILPTDNNSTRTAGSMITLVRAGADRWYAGGPT